MEAIKEYLRSCHDVIRVLLAYIIRKTTIVQIYGDYPKKATSDNEMIARMSYLPTKKNKLLSEHDAQSA